VREHKGGYKDGRGNEGREEELFDWDERDDEGRKKALERTARLDREDSQSDKEEDTEAYFNSTRLNRGL
jgi:hypothetical protein